MRPTTPNLDFAHQAGPTSPPQTPTTPSFAYRQYKTRRNGIYFTQSSTVTIPGVEDFNDPTQNLPPYYAQASELSPRSSSPASSDQSLRSNSPPPPRSLSSSPGPPLASPPPPQKLRLVAESKANFIIEDFDEEDYEDYDSDAGSVIRPTQYEDAESDCEVSVKPIPLPRNILQPQIDPHVLSALDTLQFDKSDDEEYAAREAFIQKLRAEKRRKRRSSSSFKRSLAQSIGSDTDDEDLVPGLLDSNDAGSSARRLRRRTGERVSLIFDDPPPRIDELEEPESCEEFVEIVANEDDDMATVGLMDLPYWIQEDMDLDTSSDEAESGDEESDSDED